MTGLDDLGNESRTIATPWSRLVRGIGLGQYPVRFDPRAADRIRTAFDLIGARVTDANAYHRFSRLMAELALDVTDPRVTLGRQAAGRRIDDVLDAVRRVEDPYWRVMAGCILLDGAAKLGLEPALVSDDAMDVPAKVVAMVDDIEPDRIQDENQGRHGDYERLSASTAVLLAHGQLGIQQRLVTGPRNFVLDALDLLEHIPGPFFRGRGGSMLLTATSLLGLEDLALDGDRDRVRDVLDYLDRADELALPPAFPQPMTEAFGRIYPLLTMLNAVAATGREEYLTHGKDRLAEVRELFAALSSAERTHMGLYYIVALHNLGLTGQELPSLDRLVEDIVGTWRSVDPGDNFFLNGIAYPYMIQTAMVTGRTDLVTDELLDRVVDSYTDLERNEIDRTNRPYPFGYLVNVLGELDAVDRLFEPRQRYGGRSAFEWVAAHLSPDAEEEGSRLHILDHALIGYALRQRGADAAESRMFQDFTFGLAEREARP
ncbi:hypothetical protein [Myceligenerans salitolerans]|uniref:Uncharacterized protein n=1 Tax=Myceligenerans salitolerans TaxID=1230528 RepID=A0ABS3I7W3_9MICO|nr:hypothetical protein [Myceligenerans salitolerans]MBO0609093.1 hypothetical protein [Myceligenerans salitolerans]